MFSREGRVKVRIIGCGAQGWVALFPENCLRKSSFNFGWGVQQRWVLLNWLVCCQISMFLIIIVPKLLFTEFWITLLLDVERVLKQTLFKCLVGKICELARHEVCRWAVLLSWALYILLPILQKLNSWIIGLSIKKWPICIFVEHNFPLHLLIVVPLFLISFKDERVNRIRNIVGVWVKAVLLVKVVLIYLITIQKQTRLSGPAALKRLFV